MHHLPVHVLAVSAAAQIRAHKIGTGEIHVGEVNALKVACRVPSPGDSDRSLHAGADMTRRQFSLRRGALRLRPAIGGMTR